ncbi:hypothetical protein BBO99_00006261 [Phytophthora kernoviae]|uniref:WW domain-containing protein n=1 Tax=Phytophthora kernoviae TaxID=325452 RepID=A0A3R7JXZ0_9STRA|nr:hypothetical protein JM16_006078 [Phytophthora kernoviae]KAG2523363.1 hypothetical protein JM18_005796 [Phytophthora kernoviae]RLN44885.1 hypothetical protein BBI17_006355 [Phytophthora kernoviae]RLN78044.1 hypothetical protein BBO99_00006261 [Phytophthora kernoviae]
MATLSTLWGCRLTFNFWRKGGYKLNEEDYRWAVIRKQMHWTLFEVFNVVFIAGYQHLLLLLLAVPSYAVYFHRHEALNAVDAVATALFLALLVLETMADQQQWNFYQKKYELIAQNQPLTGDYKAGFNRSGLFRYSRHPNFFGEMFLWWAFYLFSVAVSESALNPSSLGTILLTLLFQGSTPFTESITAAKYPLYKQYQRRVSTLHENYARRKRCFRCRAPKVVRPDALVVDSQGDRHAWREALDPASSKIYYYNTQTNQTQWERPVEMGAAPHATGWFGRGKVGVDEGSRYEALNAKFLSRPARKQLDVMPTANSQLEGAYEYNIWYDKYVGDHWNDSRGKEPATTRCDLELDAGKTKADVVSKANRYFCVHFARGMCARGAECNYYHRLPSAADEMRLGMMHDCFGRERHATDRDDMSGVGNFTSNSRTLYIGGLKSTGSEGKDAVKTQEQALWKQFGEWGEVENINVIHRKSICFVRYRHRTSAEFAKEAMANQPLQSDEVLNVRWAYDDPNPVAKQAGERADHDAIVAMVQAKGGTTTEDAAFDYPEQYQMPASKRQRVEGNTVASYPNTDTQFTTSGNIAAESTAAVTSEQELYAQLSYANSSGEIPADESLARGDDEAANNETS